MGHSFGGRVAIRYSAHNSIEKLVLFGSPCIRVDKELPFRVKLLKGLKKLPGMNSIGEFMKNYIGSRDYKAASPVMRQTLVNVVNADLSDYAKSTLIHEMCHGYVEAIYGTPRELEGEDGGTYMHLGERCKDQWFYHGKRFAETVKMASEKSGYSFNDIFGYGIGHSNLL